MTVFAPPLTGILHDTGFKDEVSDPIITTYGDFLRKIAHVAGCEKR